MWIHRNSEGAVADWLIRRVIPILLAIIALACFEHPRNPVNRFIKMALDNVSTGVQDSSPIAP